MSAEQSPQQITERAGNGHPIIEARGICKYFGGVTALQDVDFRLYPNEIRGLVGDNGAGKSTLVKILSGAYRPDKGEVYVEGERVSITNPSDAFALGIATVYQDLALIDCRDVTDNLFVGRELTKYFMLDRRRMVSESEELVKALKVRLPSVETKVKHLSGGQRQATAIGRAVIEGGRILLLDEPTAALGVRESEQMLSLIERLKEEGKSVVIVSHNLRHIFRAVDSITVLRGGRHIGTLGKSECSPEDIVGMITGAEFL